MQSLGNYTHLILNIEWVEITPTTTTDKNTCVCVTVQWLLLLLSSILKMLTYRQMDKTHSTIHPWMYFREKVTFSINLKIECMRASMLWKIPSDFILYIHGKTLTKCPHSSLFDSLFIISKTQNSHFCCCTHKSPSFWENFVSSRHSASRHLLKYLNTWIFSFFRFQSGYYGKI